jgi:phosphorylcholine metabolism protein LicD
MSYHYSTFANDMFNNDEMNIYYDLYNKRSVDNDNKQNILTQHGDITIDWKKNAEKVASLMNKYRVELFKLVINILHDNTIPYYLSDGSALGCYRSGKMIPYDVDIDITISEERLVDTISLLKNNLYSVQSDNVKINPKHILIQTQDRYSKLDWNVTTDKFTDLYNNYDNIAKKICVKYTGHLNDFKNHDVIPDLFAIVIDIYTYRLNDQYMTVNYKHKDIDVSHINYPLSTIFPFKSRIFENISVFTVSDLKYYLETLYGYIGEDCYWDKDIQKFRKKTLE